MHPKSVPFEMLRETCQRWEISQLSLFGSALREDFSNDSDVDLIATFDPESKPFGLFGLMQIEQDMERLFGRPVDLLTEEALSSMRNPYHSNAIRSTRQILYAA